MTPPTPLACFYPFHPFLLALASSLVKPGAVREWSVTCGLQRRDKDTYPVAFRGATVGPGGRYLDMGVAYLTTRRSLHLTNAYESCVRVEHGISRECGGVIEKKKKGG